MRPRVVGRGQWTVTLPGGPLTLLQIAIGIVDLGFCALAMYMLVPRTPHTDFVTVAVIFVSATLLGFASHSPGGLGVFDAAMLVGLWQFDREELLAGMLLFRVLYYITPFVLSLLILGVREIVLGGRVRGAALSQSRHTDRPRRATSSPEALTKSTRRGLWCGRNAAPECRGGISLCRRPAVAANASSLSAPWSDRIKRAAIILLVTALVLGGLVILTDLSLRARSSRSSASPPRRSFHGSCMTARTRGTSSRAPIRRMPRSCAP